MTDSASLAGQFDLIFHPSELIVVPNDLVLFQLRERLLNERPVLLGVRIYTFSSLEARLAEEHWPLLIDGWSRSFLLGHLARQLRPALGLTQEPSLASLGELAVQLGDGLDRLRLAGLSWPETSRLQPEDLAQKAAELGEYYEEMLRLEGQEDDFGRRVKLLAALRQGADFQFLAQTQTIFCYHSQRLSPFETELLKALAARGLSVNIRLEMPLWIRKYDAGRNLGFQRFRFIQDLEKSDLTNINLEFTDHYEDENDYPPMNSRKMPEAFWKSPGRVPRMLRFASAALFEPLPEEKKKLRKNGPEDQAGDEEAGALETAGKERPSPDGSLEIIKASSRYAEAEACCRMLKEEILSGTPPHHLAAAVPVLEEYLADFQDIGRRFGLKFYSRRGVPLLSAGPAAALLDLLALFDSNWELPRLRKILSSPYFDFQLKGFDFDSLNNAGLSDLRAGGGFKENLTLAVQAGRKELEPVLAAVSLLEEAAWNFELHQSWPLFLSIWQKLLDDLNWPGPDREIWPEGADANEAAGHVQREYQSALKRDEDAIGKLAEVQADLVRGLSESPFAPPADTKTFLYWFSRAVSEGYLGNSEGPAGCVWLVNYYDLHGAFFKKLFLMGLNERAFPVYKSEGSFWPEEFYNSLDQTSLGRSLWTTALERYRQGEEILAAALAQAEKVVLSYSENTQSTPPKKILPSPVLESLQALWPEEQIRTIRPDSNPALRDLRDPGELLVWLAESGFPADSPYLQYIYDPEPALVRSRILSRQKAPESPKLDPRIIGQWLKTNRFYFSRLGFRPVLTLQPLLDYARCSRLFWYRYILKLKTPGG
ncbi:MAG: hypothetical protein LBK52_02115, partial [Deltaproteobacteria bacterium]|nr:hypothetical protein [Deltaproteobacteria bacterium]